MSSYILTDVAHETPSILSLKMERATGDQPITFQPGQYATISYRKGRRPSAVRCFSIASTPTDQDHLELGIRVGGKFTHALERLKPGDAVNIDGPYGNFIFDSMSDTHIVMCAGGIGITPFMSMMRYATKLELMNQLHLVFSVRSQDDIPYFDELKRIALENKFCQITLVVDSGPTNKITEPFNIEQGRINDNILLKAGGSHPERASYFICGPPPFMKAVVKTLRAKDIPEDHIVTEAFSQGPHRQSGRSRAWPANVYAMSALGLAVSTILVLTKDMLKSIPQSILPKTLKSSASNATRQQDVDALVQTLEKKLGTNESPTLVNAKHVAKDAESKAAEVQAENDRRSSLSGSPRNTTSRTTSPTPSPTPTPSPSPSPTPTPLPSPTPTPTPSPVCTTNASGVTVCN